MIINDLRLTFVFTETILDVQTKLPPKVPLAAFVTEPGYIQTIDALQQGGKAPLDLRLPWPDPVGNHFWYYYFRNREARDARGKLCFDQLVPLRLPSLADALRTTLPEVGRFGIEGFYYPFGTGLLVSVALAGAFDVATAGALSLKVRYDRIYQTSWPAPPNQPLSLNQLVTAALDRLRALGFGGVAGQRSQLFSVATIILGKGVDPSQPLVADDEVHRLLNGLANWVQPWQKVTAPALENGVTRLDLRKESKASLGHVLFAGKRGRTVWFPERFGLAPGSTHSLGCYHRNLAIGSLQTECLLMLAAAVEDARAQAAPGPMPNSIQNLGRMAGGLLGRLFTGKDTYSSDSFRTQIQQSEQFDKVNALRQQFGMQPLP
jgi:hypothetical protein